VKIVLAGCGLITLILALLSGMLGDGYWGPMLIVIGYLVAVLLVLQFFKYRNSYKLRVS